MLFNNGQTANCLWLLITYFLWRGVEGGGGPTIKSILPKYIEKKWGKASWSNTWIPNTVLHREPRTNKWEYIPCPHLSWHTGNGYLLLEYIVYVWNNDLISQHILILFERETWVLTHIRILECETKRKEKNWNFFFLGCMGAQRWVNVSWVWQLWATIVKALGVFKC